jgi:hypothetical protein
LPPKCLFSPIKKDVLRFRQIKRQNLISADDLQLNPTPHYFQLDPLYMHVSLYNIKRESICDCSYLRVFEPIPDNAGYSSLSLMHDKRLYAELSSL